MKIFKSALTLVLLQGFLLSLAPVLFAQDQEGQNTEKPKHPLVDMQLQLGGRMKYSLGGVELHGYKPFEDIISPLNDHMATYSLNTAKDEDAISWPLILGGLAVETVGIVDGVTRYCNWRNTGVNQDYTFTWITVLGGGAIDFIGVIVQGQAQVDKFNAVKRYNAVARGEDKVSLFYSPEHKQLELGWSGRF